MELLSVGQLSKQANVTIRTIRYYDQIELLTPEYRQANGRRYYTENDLKKLEKICLLKSLSFSLDDIKTVLNKDTFKELLLQHQRQIQSDIKEGEHTLKNIQTLLNSIEVEGEFNWELLLPIFKRKEHNRELHFNEEEQKTINKLPKMEQNDISIKQWINLMKRIEKCIEEGISPLSEVGQLIAEDALLLSEYVFAGNKELEEKFWDIRKSKEKSRSAGLYPVREEVITFLDQAIDSITEAAR